VDALFNTLEKSSRMKLHIRRSARSRRRQSGGSHDGVFEGLSQSRSTGWLRFRIVPGIGSAP